MQSIWEHKENFRSPSFKTTVALEALKERETLAELSVRFGVAQEMISPWKSEFNTLQCEGDKGADFHADRAYTGENQIATIKKYGLVNKVWFFKLFALLLTQENASI